MPNLSKLSKTVSDKFRVENNTLIRDVKENSKDRISLEIGDSKDPDFKPQAKIMRWDNECNISMRAPEDPNATVVTEGEKVKYISPDGYEVHQYEKPDAGEDGGHELELHFATLETLQARSTVVGSNYRIVLTTQYKNVVGYKQLPLTQEEIDEGVERPEDVINSIAFYHESRGGLSQSDGMQYKVGKVGHQYRIKLIDDNGTETWGDQNWLRETNELEVLLPKEWVDECVFPLIVDPTIGYTSIGGTSSSFNGDRIVTNKRPALTTMSENGTVTQVSFYARKGPGDTNRNSRAAIYESDGDLLSPQSGTTAISSETQQWWDYTFSGPSLSNGVVYAPSIYGDADVSNIILYYYDTSGANSGDGAVTDGSGNYPDWDSPITFSGLQRIISLYATYTAAGGGSNIKKFSSIAYANLKKINGVAIANVKKVASIA